MGGKGPGGRIGHSMVLAGNDSRVITFGGRDNEIVRQHIPRTYEVGPSSYMSLRGALYVLTCKRVRAAPLVGAARRMTRGAVWWYTFYRLSQ